MRFLLDVHISGRKIGAALTRSGHDVLAADQTEQLQTLTDDELLEIAWHQQRILLTRDVKDFPRITYEWLQRGQTFAGCIVIVKIGQKDTRTLLRGVRQLISNHPNQEDWRDRVVYLGSSG